MLMNLTLGVLPNIDVAHQGFREAKKVEKHWRKHKYFKISYFCFVANLRRKKLLFLFLQTIIIMLSH